MSTTTIRLDDDLKQRLAAAAQRSGKSPHAFIVEAIEQTVVQAEAAEAFEQLANTRWARLLKSGKSVPFEEAKNYLEDRAKGKTVARPGPRPLSR
jgi:predicted transcriptional regulator